MQNDLISRSALIEQIKGFTNVCEGYFENHNLLMDVIEKQPTAYSVEKVVAEVDDFEIRCCDCKESCNTEGCLIERIKNVISNGGKE